MKHFYITLFLLFSVSFISAQNQPFITTWEVDNMNGLDITIPTEGTGYDYTVDFGDGTVLNNQTGDAAHTYNTAGIYTVSITGDFPRIYFFNNYGSAQKLASVEQWGVIQWQSMEDAFYNCSNLMINAIDAPDLSQVIDLSGMFAGCSSFNQPINHWDVSTVTNMSSMFYSFFSPSIFNQPLNNWDVSNVTDMGRMFGGAMDFNQNINNWDVSNVTDMGGMFGSARDFNQPLNNWDVSSVTTMKSMFSSAYNFNQNINNWDVSNVTNMQSMFRGARFYNQSLTNWDVFNVTNMDYMFAGALEFNQPLANWDVSNLTRMNFMFAGITSQQPNTFNQPIGNWDVSNVIEMKSVFQDAFLFNQSLNSWDVSNVTDMREMFNRAYSFNQPLDNWDVSNVTGMRGMFQESSSFNQDLSTWDFNTNNNFNAFVSYTAMNVDYYDKLLHKLAVSYTVSPSNSWAETLGAHGLEYCNNIARDYLINNFNFTMEGDFPSSVCSTILGSVLYDENNDGCDVNDIVVTGWTVEIDEGTFNSQTYTINGNYEIKVNNLNYTVSIINYPSYFSLTPTSQQVAFTNSNNEVADFCVTANQIVNDLNITFIPISEARPGFEADYQLVVENIGTQTLANSNVTLDFDDAMQSFISASVTPTSATANQLTFDIGDIPPLTFQTIDLTMQTFQPPTVNGDDVLSFTASVTPNTNDYTPNDNTFVFNQTVVNSFDPNDKQVLQGEEIEIDEVDEYLNYLIRFQNTGTASAINVRVLDTLHPKLDYSTLRPVNASHDYRVEITNGDQVEFIFDNINLPDENTNEPASHGFVAYKIKPKNDVAVGDFITGDASIYFDFNAPIITNTVSTEVIDNLKVNNNTVENNISVYPNPVNNVLHIRTKNGVEVQELSVYSIQGKQILFRKENVEKLDLEDLSSGMYLLSIKTTQGTLNQQLIKK